MFSIRQESPHSESESPPSKRALLIDSSSIQPITRPQHYFESKTSETVLYHRLVIENFSYYCLNGPNDFPAIVSPAFSPLSNEKLQFCLELFPNGLNKEAENYVSLFLRFCKGDRKEIDLKYELSILDSEGKDSSFCGSKRKFAENAKWGSATFCARKDILEHSNKFTPGDVLTISCVIYYENVTEDDSDEQSEINLTQLEKDFVKLKLNKELSDVVLVFGEQKKEFRAHKAILGARSEVFAAMFDHDMREKNRVEITDVDAEVGEEILDYLYGESYPDLDVYAEKLLPIADKYKLNSLKSICEGELCFRINPQSVCKLLLLGDIHNAELLKSKCLEYIRSHPKCVVASDSMYRSFETRPELFYEMFMLSMPFTFVPPTLTVDPSLSGWSYVGSVVHKFSELWTIDNFDANHLSVEEDENNLTTFLESKVFPSKGAFSSVQFSVKLCPQEEDDDHKNHLSLYLRMKCDEEIEVAVKARVSIVVNGNSAKGYTLEIAKELSNGESIGWKKFITHEQLTANKELLLNGTSDQLVLLCEVFYIEDIDKPVVKSGLNTFDEEHEFSIVRDLSKLYQSQKLMDAVFVLGDKEFNVHKSVMSARSSVFARMFASSNRVQIDDVSNVDAFEQMLALVYGQTDVLTQWAHKMLPLLDQFELYSLRHVCQHALCNQLNEENVADLVMLADKHNATLLKAKAFEWIRIKHSVLIQNDALKIVQRENPKLFYELLCYNLETNWISLSDK